MTATAVSTDSKVGKYEMTVKPSSKQGPSSADRIEALANWLVHQWEKQQIQKN